MKINIYNFYKEKYNLKTLNINISKNKIIFLIYDDKYYYLKDNEFISTKENFEILDKINFLNCKYKLDITNFYPVCFCNKSLVIALKTNSCNANLEKYNKENFNKEYQELINYHQLNFLTLFVSSNVKKEISMGRKYINRYKFHEKVLKKFIFTEKKRHKKEFLEILYNMLPNKKTIIDVSCGDNSDIFKIAKKKKYQNVVGNDICLDYLNLAKNENIIYTNDDIEFNRIKDKSYDVSFCKNTLHHMNNISNINNALKFLDRISNTIIIVEIMNPKEYKGLPKILNKYLYTKFLKDVGNCYLNEEQLKNIINNNFKKSDIEYKTFKNILGTYKIVKITNKEN